MLFQAKIRGNRNDFHLPAQTIGKTALRSLLMILFEFQIAKKDGTLTVKPCIADKVDFIICCIAFSRPFLLWDMGLHVGYDEDNFK